jgi:hypothetical protein
MSRLIMKGRAIKQVSRRVLGRIEGKLCRILGIEAPFWPSPWPSGEETASRPRERENFISPLPGGEGLGVKAKVRVF